MDKDTERSLLLTHHIKPDYGFYVQGDDRLALDAYASVASLRIRASGYFLSANGEIRQYAVELAPTSDRAVTTGLTTIGEGMVLTCVPRLISGNAKRGQCYVRARIQRGDATTILPMGTLLGGYLHDNFSPTFPYGKIESPLEGIGWLRAVSGTDPAAGSEISETVPTGARWRVHSLRATLVNDANVANRQVTMTIDDGTTIVLRTGLLANQAASATNTYTFAAWGADNALAAAYVNPMFPTYPLPAGWRVRTLTTNLQVGDNWGTPALLVEEHLEA